MIIQNIPNTGQAIQPGQVIQPDMLAHRAEPVGPVAVPQVQSAPQPSAEALNNAVATINNVMQHANLDLKFSVDTDSNRTVVKMVDTSTGELIRQFPSESALAISQGIEQFQQGLLIKQEA